MGWNRSLRVFVLALATAGSAGIQIGLTPANVLADQQSDAALRAELHERMRNDSRVQSYTIQIETNDARVTLRGTVSSIAERNAAMEIALATPGLREISNQITVAPPRRAAGDLQRDAIASLRARSDLNGSRIKVAARGRTVWLMGEFPTLAMLDRSIETVEQIRGVGRVDASRSKVVPRVAFTDPQVRTAVARTLLQDGTLDASQIRLAVVNGSVLLRGTVTSLFQINQAEQLARSVTGVRAVTNKLQLAAPAARPVG